MKRFLLSRRARFHSKMFFVICCALILCETSVSEAYPEEKLISFTVPASPWTLTLPAADFKIAQEQIKPDGRYGYFFITDEKTGLAVSMFIEPVKDCKDSKSCRDMVWKMGNPSWENPQDIVLSEIGEVSCFLVPSFRGDPVRRQNLYAKFVVEGFWVDLHISRVRYKPREHELFERIVESIKFEPNKNPKS